MALADAADAGVVATESVGQGVSQFPCAPGAADRGEHDHRPAGCDETGNRRVVALDEGVQIRGGAQHVIGAGMDGDDVGFESKCIGNLDVDDLVEKFPPHRQVRVGDSLITGLRIDGQAPGQPVRPSEEPAIRAQSVMDSLGEGVP